MADHGVLVGSFEEIVARYLADYASDEDRELKWFRRQTTLSEAVRLAGMAERPFGKRFNHQRRIPVHVLGEFTARLLGLLSEIERATTFQEIHRLVEEIGRGISGIGELAIYDAAVRIGAKLGIEPDRVYLHTGTRAGASLLGLGKGRPWITIGELPQAFSQLNGRQAEDCLCIFRESIRALTAV